MPTSSDAVWQELLAAAERAHKHDGWVRRHALDLPGTRLWFAIRIDSRFLAVMLDVPAKACASLKQLPATAGLSVSIERFSELPQDTRAIAVALREPEFADIFAVFADDLIRRLSRCVGISDALATLFARIERWQRFLAAAQEGLSESALVGLMGELLVLRDLILPAIGAVAVSAWTGPERDLNDFQFADGLKVEIKATTSPALSHVRINHESQLAYGPSGLFLICLRLTRGTGTTLNDLIGDLRLSLSKSPEFAALFESRLYEAGYWDRHADRYNASKFYMAECRMFIVGNGFPAISARDLPPGVDEISYRVALSACGSFVTTADAFRVALSKGMAS